ncbi:MAG: transglutaminase family protein, partial [Bacteroidia bacterium]|nr:transglutaminase-like domain-containing protein [Bacteroidia bacterium]MDW8134438.1 transglutaminase family protein [Bacteroidia bacterium]
EAALREVGREAIPLLEQHWLHTEDPVTQRRIEELLEQIQLDTVGQALYEWRLNPQQPLFPALMYVAQLRYPSLDTARYTNAYRRLIHTTWLALPAGGDPFEKLLALNRHLFIQERFQPEHTRPYASRYFFIHEVLETKRGNSFSLGVIYFMIASELSMEVSLIAVGNRYLIRYFDGAVHFYLDPYQKGLFLLPAQLREVLRRVNISDNLAHYPPLSPPYIILRLIEHLEQAYEKEGDLSKKELYRALRKRIDLQL